MSDKYRYISETTEDRHIYNVSQKRKPPDVW